MDGLSKLKDFIVTQVGNKNLSAADATEFIKSLTAQAASAQGPAASRDATEIAVVGYDCKLPASRNPAEFWHNMVKNKDCISAFPKARMDDVIYINEKTYEQYKLLNCRVGGYLENVDRFDYEFFGISPIEARDMDPSHRLFLETSVAALQHAGLTREKLDNSRTGVFIGYSMSEDNFADLLGKENPNLALGNQPAMMAYRLAFMYNFKGPTMAIDTTCSSSLVTLHMARRAILSGDCDQAVVAGVNLRIFPAIREISNLGIEAFDGRCRPFDAAANGTNIGDGFVTVILKRKDLAVRDQDYIHGVVLGSAINSDGASNGLTAPNPESQADVLSRAWDDAGIKPESIKFIETHGTGTKLGDPIEIHGLTVAARKYTKQSQFMALSGTKANIGHLEATAGIAGFLKALLCVKHRYLPTILHYQKPNPYIDFKSSPVFVPEKPTHWDVPANEIIAGISSFGITGTNSHVVLAGYENTAAKDAATTQQQVLFVSAKSTSALLGNLKKYQELCTDELDLAALSYSTAVRCDHYAHRVAIIAANPAELRQRLALVIAQLNENEALKSLPDQGIYYADTERGDLVTVATAGISGDQQLMLEDFLSDSPIDWQDSLGSARFMPLPSYSFDELRCWPKLTIDKSLEQENRIKDLFYQIVWRPQELEAFNGVVNPDKYQLLFLRRSVQAETLVAFLRERGASLIIVYADDAYQNLGDNEFTIQVENADDYVKLFATIKQSELPLDTIVHALDWCQPASTMGDYQDLLSGQNYGSLSMFHLINAMEKSFKTLHCKMVTLSTNAHQVTGEETNLDPSRMTSLGVNKVISQEYPMIESIFIDCDVPSDTEKQVELIYNEAIVRPHLVDHILAIRNETRYRQVLERIEHDSLAAADGPVIKPQSTYLIAGGSGYLGMETALHIARKANANIAIASRSDYSFLNTEDLADSEDDKLQKMIQVIREVRGLGSNISFIQGDVTEEKGCASVVEKCREIYGPIHGVFIAIKNISHKRLNAVSVDEFKFNIFSKLKGVYLLNKYTENDPVDVFVTFSSISSLTGGPTGADCSASNLFLDSYGDYRNRVLGKRTITLNYTLIDADNGSLDSDRLTMIPPLTKEECFKCMDVFLETDLNFAVMADFASSVTHKVLPYMKVNFSDDILAEFDKYAGKSVKAPKAKTQALEAQATTTLLTEKDIKDSITKAFKEVLGHSDVKPYDNFFEIGGDSISAVKLIDKLNNLLQAGVEVSILYDCPCVADLTNFFLQKEQGEAPAANASEEQKADISDLLDKLDGGELSLEELAQQI